MSLFVIGAVQRMSSQLRLFVIGERKPRAELVLLREFAGKAWLVKVYGEGFEGDTIQTA